MNKPPFGGSARLSRRSLLRTTAAATAVAAAGSLASPAILRAQNAVRIGHLTPRTGFLGQLGVYGLNAARLAVDEINEAGGVRGQNLELIDEDSVNPGTAVTKAEQLIQQNEVVALLGEISSASALAIGEAAQRHQSLYINTGANSDALRGENCNRYMFHVEGANTMYTRTIGRWQLAENLIEGSEWYFLTPTTPSAMTCGASRSASTPRTAAPSRATSWCPPTRPTSAPISSTSAPPSRT